MNNVKVNTQKFDGKPLLAFALLAIGTSVMGTASANSEQCTDDAANRSSHPYLGPMAVGQRYDAALVSDEAVTRARRAGFKEHLEFRAIELPATKANYSAYCANTQTDRVTMFWMRGDCAGIVVSDRESGEISDLIRDCSADLVRTGQSVKRSPGAALAAAVRARYGNPHERLAPVPVADRGADQSRLMVLR